MRQNDFSAPSVELIVETGVNKVIPFLDVLIDNRNNILNTTTYDKSIYSGLLLDFDSFTSRFYKISLIIMINMLMK